MRCNVLVTPLLLVLTITATCYAVDPRQYDELDRGRVLRPEPRPPVEQPAPVRERQEMQRSESQNRGENATGLRNPETVSIDRLKLRSDTVAEYQFEPLPTLNQQSDVPTPQQQDQAPPQSEANVEEAQQASSEAVTEEIPAEQSAEAVIESDSSANGDDPVTEKIVTAGGTSAYKIMEDSNRIIVVQVDADQKAGGKQAQH